MIKLESKFKDAIKLEKYLKVPGKKKMFVEVLKIYLLLSSRQ